MVIPNPRTWFWEIRHIGGGELAPCINQRDYKDPPMVIEIEEDEEDDSESRGQGQPVNKH